MTADDLTRLRDVAIEAAKYKRGDRSMLAGEAFSAWANQVTPPTVAALIDRVERAERERDELREKIEFWVDERDLEIEKGDDARSELAALRAAVAGLADEWEGRAMTCCSLTCKNCGARYIDPDELRGLLTEGADE